MDLKDVVREMASLRAELQDLKTKLARTATTENAAGSGGGVASVAVTSPITNSGTPTAPNIGLGISPVLSLGTTAPLSNTGTPTAPVVALSATTTNDGGTIVKQAAFPGTTQTGNGHVSGSLGADFRFYLGSVPILEAGSLFPTSGLVDKQRYWHDTYRSWFTYNLAQTKWRQDSPGVFDGSFPTVAGADNTVAPNIEVRRKDLNNRIYFWNGSVWLPIAGTIVTLDKVCRIYDTTAALPNATALNIQVTGATDLATGWLTLPSTLRSVKYSVFILTAAATGVNAVVENPDFIVGASTMRGTTAQQAAGGNFAYSGSGVVSLSSLGQLRLVYNGTAAGTRLIVDVWEYMT